MDLNTMIECMDDRTAGLSLRQSLSAADAEIRDLRAALGDCGSAIQHLSRVYA